MIIMSSIRTNILSDTCNIKEIFCPNCVPIEYFLAKANPIFDGEYPYGEYPYGGYPYKFSPKLDLKIRSNVWHPVDRQVWSQSIRTMRRKIDEN